jgi:methylase of polypeptide subunit release factors
MNLIEIHDHPRFPAFLWNLVTDGLEALWASGNTYKPILPRLLNALDHAETGEVLDLCSGGGGPWLRLAKELQGEQHFDIEVCLSDKYPNRTAFE